MKHSEKGSYEMTDNEIYSAIDCQTCASSDAAYGTVKADSSRSWRCTCVIGALILVNFLLIIAVGATLFFYQTQLSSQLAAEVAMFKSNTSEALGLSGKKHVLLTLRFYCACSIFARI